MSILYVALPVALLLVVIFAIAFVWSVRTGQMDDLDTPAVRMLHDDEPGTEGKVSQRRKDRQGLH